MENSKKQIFVISYSSLKKINAREEIMEKGEKIRKKLEGKKISVMFSPSPEAVFIKEWISQKIKFQQEFGNFLLMKGVPEIQDIPKICQKLQKINSEAVLLISDLDFSDPCFKNIIHNENYFWIGDELFQEI